VAFVGGGRGKKQSARRGRGKTRAAFLASGAKRKSASSPKLKLNENNCPVTGEEPTRREIGESLVGKKGVGHQWRQGVKEQGVVSGRKWRRTWHRRRVSKQSRRSSKERALFSIPKEGKRTKPRIPSTV